MRTAVRLLPVTRRLAPAVTAILLAAAFGACGSDDEETQADRTQTAPVATQRSEPESTSTLRTEDAAAARQMRSQILRWKQVVDSEPEQLGGTTEQLALLRTTPQRMKTVVERVKDPTLGPLLRRLAGTYEEEYKGINAALGKPGATGKPPPPPDLADRRSEIAGELESQYPQLGITQQFVAES